MSSGSPERLKDLAASVVVAYEDRTAESRRWFERSRQHLVGGVTGNLRHFSPYPLYFAGGEGATAVDIDGNRYIDTFLCNGPLLLGHRHPAVMDALDRSRAVGSLVLNPVLATEVAELVVAAVPSAEKVRFLNSGTEAVMAAVRYARAHTGRTKIVKFFGHYHGMDDPFLAGMGASSRRAVGAGVPENAAANTLLLQYGDIEAVEVALEDDDDVAAVILDASMHNGGLWGSDPEFLQRLRTLTLSKGVLLIFDEVITGFRLGLGGAQEYYDVAPDLTVLGKALAAGEKLGAVAGSAEVMSVVDPAGDPRHVAFQSGTGNDATGALAAARAAIGEYRLLSDSGGYERMWSLGTRLASGLTDVFAEAGIPCRANHLGPMLQLFLTSEEPSFAAYSRVDTRVLNIYFQAMLAEGVLLTLPGSNHIYLSAVHGSHHIESVLETTRLVLQRHDFAGAWSELNAPHNPGSSREA